MSRLRNNVRGPTSALTEFLRESGITPTTIARRAATRQQPPNEGDAGPSTATAAPSAASPATIGPSTRRRQDVSGFESDNLDEEEEEEEAPAPKKKRVTKAAEAKQKAKQKKEKGKAENEDEDDAYTALSKMWTGGTASARPANGSFANCAKCEDQFTVTKYTLACSTGPGFLCHPCTKAAGTDPFKKPAAPRKRKAPADKRKVTHFEEQRFPSLVSLCVQIISRHINDIDSFGDIGALNREAIAKALSKTRSLTPENAPLFYGAEQTKLSLYDATKLVPTALITLAQLNPNLTTLRIDFCGRIDNEVMKAWTQLLPMLTSLELLGPFLVYAEFWIAFFASHARLESFFITQSPRFNLECMQALAEHSGSTITRLGLKEVGKLDDEFLTVIQQLPKLAQLDISEPAASCSDDAVVSLLKERGSGLTSLNLSGHIQLSDYVLEHGLRANAVELTSLSLSNLPEISDAGVAQLFTGWQGNPPLTSLNLARNTELSTDALLAILRHSGECLQELSINGWKDVSGDALSKLGTLARELRTVDVSWCRSMDDFIVRDLIQGNKGSLSELKVWGCTKVEGKWERQSKCRALKVYGIEMAVH